MDTSDIHVVLMAFRPLGVKTLTYVCIEGGRPQKAYKQMQRATSNADASNEER